MENAEIVVASFHKIVLSWDYVRLLKDSNKKSKENALGLKEVKNSYKDVDDYKRTFEPLLFEEVKAHIVQGRDEEEEEEWIFGAITRYDEDARFHLPVVAYDSEDRALVENDLLLISKDKFDEKLSTTYAFAFVLNREDRNHVELRMFKAGEVEGMNTDKIKPVDGFRGMNDIFKAPDDEKRGVWILKIASLSTIIRDYVALCSIHSLPFKDLVLSAAEKDASSEHRDILKDILTFGKYLH